MFALHQSCPESALRRVKQLCIGGILFIFEKDNQGGISQVGEILRCLDHRV